MDATNELLDKCKEARNIKTDMALAAALGVSRGTVSGWRSGVRHPDTVACARIADLAGEPLQRVLGIVGEARALSAEEKRVWRRLAEAAVIAFAVMLPALPSHAAPVSLNDGHVMHYAKWRRLARLLQRLRFLMPRSRNASPVLA